MKFWSEEDSGLFLSFSEEEENEIGSNCGQFATHFIEGDVKIKKGYTCENYNLLE